jgi:hypothetical protein
VAAFIARPCCQPTVSSYRGPALSPHGEEAFGAFIAKRFVLRLEPDIFRMIMDAIMIAAGLAMLWTAATG